MRFCEQCGARLEESASACERCGYRRPGEPPSGRSAEPPPPPTGYALRSAPAAGNLQQTSPGPSPMAGYAPRPTVPPAPTLGPRPAVATPAFPGAAIPPLVAALTLLITTAYATLYALIEWGSLDPADVFFTVAAPTVFGAPFVGYDSVGDWLDYGPFGGGWTIAIPLVAVVLLTAILVSRTNLGAGARLAVGGLVFAPLALLAGVSTLIADNLLTEGAYYDLGEVVLKAAGGAAIVGLLGGLLGALVSIAIRPPLAVDRRR